MSDPYAKHVRDLMDAATGGGDTTPAARAFRRAYADNVAEGMGAKARETVKVTRGSQAAMRGMLDVLLCMVAEMTAQHKSLRARVAVLESDNATLKKECSDLLEIVDDVDKKISRAPSQIGAH